MTSLSAWVKANSKASVSCPSVHTVYDCSQQFTAAKFHFALANPIAHYPVDCIRNLIFSFSTSSEERSTFMINPLYSNE
jgi:hypothetical protein